MVFKVEPSAKADIQEGINYYNDQQKGLGKKFHAEVKVYFNAIRKNPFYQIRYDKVRCWTYLIGTTILYYCRDAMHCVPTMIVRTITRTSN